MYSQITNPSTGKKVNVYGKFGMNIIKNYIKILNNQVGGAKNKKFCQLNIKTNRCIGTNTDPNDGKCIKNPKTSRCKKNEKQYKKPVSIKVLYYNGTISGSRELRKYNQTVVSKMYNAVDSDIQGTPHHYFKEYDKIKSAEPFYDAFVVHLAHLNPEEYSNYGLERIEYIEQDLSEEDITYPIPNTHENNIFNAKKTENVLIRSKEIDQMYTKNTCHIFILSPMSNKLVDNVKSICKQCEKEKTNTIIHIQGDVTGGNVCGDHEGTGMTQNPGMFAEAFNLFSGGESFKNLRQYLRNSKAKFYSVSPIASDRNVVNRAAQECKSKYGPRDAYNQVDANRTTPKYYIEANNDTLTLALMQKTENGWNTEEENQIIDRFNSLNVKAVYQDGTDKDNLGSMIALCKFNHSYNIPIHFMGLRIYSSSSIGFGPPGSPPMTFNFGGSALENPTGEYAKPADNRGPMHGNQRFEKDITLKFYKNQAKGFFDVLRQAVNNFTPEVNTGFIVDGIDENSESFRAPFNMSLFTFTANTYQEDALKLATGTDNLAAAQARIKGVDVPKA